MYEGWLLDTYKDVSHKNFLLLMGAAGASTLSAFSSAD